MTVATFGSNIRQRGAVAWNRYPRLMHALGETGSWLAIALLGIAVAGLVFVVVAPRLFGWQFVVVAGGSMEPAVPFGSVAVMEDVQPSDLKVRDIVMFREPNGKVVTHRIVDITDGGRALTTQGDANNTPDEGAVPASAVQGRFRFAIPEVGRFVRWMGTQQGYLTLILVPGMMIIGLELVSIGRSLRRKPAPITAKQGRASDG